MGAADAKRTPQTIRAILRGQAGAAAISNRAFLNQASPTQAQTLAQVRALTRQTNELIRLLLDDFTGTD